MNIRNRFLFVGVVLLFFISVIPSWGKPYPWEVEKEKTPPSQKTKPVPPAIPTPQHPAGETSPEPAASAKATYQRAVKYYLGKGVTKDFQRAFLLFKEAADQGYPSAQHMTGVCYEYGRGTRKDLEEAFRYYLLGAKSGNVKAQFKVGAFYWFGKGRKKDFTKAVAWYSRSADQGFGPALNNLGVAYENAFGTKRNLEKARAYYEKAARKGNVKGYENLVRLSEGMGRPVPTDIGNRARMGFFDVRASRHWVAVSLPADKKGKQWIMGYVPKEGVTPNPFVLFRSDSFEFTSAGQREKIEKSFIKEMKVRNPRDVQYMKMARHKTLVLRSFDGKDTTFTLLPYDDISLHLIVVLYNGQKVAKLTPQVRAYLSTLVFRND